MGGVVVLVLLVVWHGVSSTVVCWFSVDLGLSVEMEISGRAFTILYYVGPGCLWWTNVLNSALPPQRLRLDTWIEHQDPVSHTALSCSSQPEGACCLAAHLSIGQCTTQDRTGRGWGQVGEEELGAKGSGHLASTEQSLPPGLTFALLRPASAAGGQAALEPQVLTGSPSQES